MWLLQLGLQLGANVINAYTTLHTREYIEENKPSLGDLMMLFATRPRIVWILLTILGSFRMKTKQGGPRIRPAKEVPNAHNGGLSTKIFNLVESANGTDSGPEITRLREEGRKLKRHKEKVMVCRSLMATAHHQHDKL